MEPSMNEADIPTINRPKTRRRKTIDLTNAFAYAFRDKDWFAKLAIHGLLMLIPILGSIIIMGWQRQAVEGLKAGDEELPRVDIGRSLSEGVAPFIAVLNAGIPMFLFAIGSMVLAMVSVFAGIVLAEEMNQGIFVLFGVLIALVAYAGIFIAAIAMLIVMPELRRRGFHGEMFPLLSPGKSIRAWKAQPIGYLVVCVGFILTGFLGGLGVYACYVGMILTMPWAHATNANLLAQYDMLVGDGPKPEGDEAGRSTGAGDPTTPPAESVSEDDEDDLAAEDLTTAEEPDAALSTLDLDDPTPEDAPMPVDASTPPEPSSDEKPPEDQPMPKDAPTPPEPSSDETAPADEPTPPEPPSDKKPDDDEPAKS
jgi:hypothetical protein